MIQHERYTPWAQPGPYRIADYRRYDGDEACELLCGRFIMSPAPSNRHQILVALMTEILMRTVRSHGGRMLIGPADVVLEQQTVVQPDLFYVRQDRVSILGSQETHGAPDIVVEVLSPGTRRRDRIEKLGCYATAGVPEYWIGDPEDRVMQFLILSEGGYRIAGVTGEDIYRSARCTGVEVDVPALWSDFERLAPRE